MMEITIKDTGLFGHADITLNDGETFMSESGALFKMSSNTRLDTSSRKRKGGGFLKAAKRLLAGENFFLTEYGSKDGQPIHLSLAPVLPGDCMSFDADGASRWYCTGGSWLGCSSGVSIDTEFAGMGKAIAGGEGLFYIVCSGTGKILVSAFGRIHKVDVDGDFNVDSGHVVAYQDSLTVAAGVATGSGVSGFFTSSLVGEGFVMKFSGKGTVYVQSHAPNQFGRSVGPTLPPRS
ncbi:MAG: TIGR00266 family protein [Phycisphaerae bacterium]|nr:TIGR00266 family protein [Phycisphaerae bacterium]